LKINLAFLNLISILAVIELQEKYLGTSMTFLNTYSLNNLTPIGTESDLLSLINPSTGALLSVVSIKDRHEQDSNYYGMN